MVKKEMVEVRILKIILITYILLCLAIAGLNYGYASHASEKVANFINWFWHFYENWVKTIFIIICSYLTIKIVKTQGRLAMRKRNLIGFIITALVVHIIGPILLQNKELYFFTMPLPWTSTPLQLLYSNSSFYQSHYPIWGTLGITTALIFYICFSILVIVGTFLFGRRWQCSTLCLFNGFASEIFEPAIPLIGKSKKITPRKKRLFLVLRWIFLIVALFFTLWWVLFLLGVTVPGDFKVMSKVESFKYLTTELLMAMFFWVTFIGRGYCNYCPVGTIVAIISKIAGQKINTTNTKCIQCSKCNKACPMSINIKEFAFTGQMVKDINCVGCGHCVDICPTKTLSYSTNFLEKLHTINKKYNKNYKNNESNLFLEVMQDTLVEQKLCNITDEVIDEYAVEMLDEKVEDPTVDCINVTTDKSTDELPDKTVEEPIVDCIDITTDKSTDELPDKTVEEPTVDCIAITKNKSTDELPDKTMEEPIVDCIDITTDKSTDELQDKTM
ncbi:MAG: 4Fe-4S ferredoxin [Anaerocolumna sp.]|jgi:polyferredoxin|nr:4Fe-4S ferredoxin [Anaerocolumna sp.]